MNYVYLKNTPVFTIKAFKQKQFKRWDNETKKMLTSPTWQKDFKASYQFVLDNDDILDLSKDQVMQCLIGAFEAGKPLAGLTFEAKDNGKEGLEKRWFVNLVKRIDPTVPPQILEGNNQVTKDVSADEIPW